MVQNFCDGEKKEKVECLLFHLLWLEVHYEIGHAWLMLDMTMLWGFEEILYVLHWLGS